MERGFDACIDAGSLVFANYIAGSMTWLAFERGDTLGDALALSVGYADFAWSCGNEIHYCLIAFQQQLIKRLMGGKDDSGASSGKKHMDEGSCLASVAQTSYYSAITAFHISKMVNAWIMDDLASACSHAEAAQKTLHSVMTQPAEASYISVHALILIRIYKESSEERQQEIITTLSEYRDRFSLWAESCPENFACKHTLIAAGIAEIENDEETAGRLFEQAIETARRSGFLHWEAMAHEAAARFHASRGLVTASRAYLREARACYARWGAAVKVDQLDALHPWLAETASAIQAANGAHSNQLDMLAITKAQRAISGEMVRDKLAGTLLRLVMEHAGAQNGHLFVEPNLELFAESGSDGILTYQQTPPPAFPGVAESILNYVRRTGNSVILADAATDAGDFTNDDHLRKVKPKSILCLPILLQAKLLGTVYLENNLAVNAFTQAHRSVLEVLASQAAISLENARTYRALQESEVKYRRMVDTAREGILTIDGQDKVTFVNAHMARMLGYTEGELQHHQLADLIQPDELADHRQRMANRRRNIAETYERRLIRRDGSFLWVLIAGAPIFEGDRYRGSLSMVTDITELKEKEDELKRYKGRLEEKVQQRTEELRQARDAAEAANRAKSVFLANMSHELRTPLNAILGFSQMLQQDRGLNPRQYETLGIINNSGEHLLKLINDVLDIAKIESGKLQLQLADLDLHALVREVTNLMQLLAQQKGLRLALEQSSDFPRYIKGDEARLRQILVNLVSNAVKFTEQGSVTIRLGAHRNDRLSIQIEVQDSGPGIGEADRERLFKPFVQLAENREQKGSGLGLAITKHFIDLMGGTIVLDSTLGKGSLFRVELPVEEADATETTGQAQASRRQIVGLAPDQPCYRILIVEDEIANQLLLQHLMNDLGLEAKLADNGEECLRIFEEWPPDLIWMDWRMPVMDGEEATRRIRQLPGGEQVKIVAVTASAFKDEHEKMIAAGMDSVVHKPFRFQDIYDSLAQQLGLRFIYTDAGAEQRTPVLEAKRLALLPVALRTDLKDALVSLDVNAIADVIRRIGEQDAELGEALSRLAERFKYPSILKALGKL
jgi:PAS domain S-box-containing protein